jgi:hypothetical protein
MNATRTQDMNAQIEAAVDRLARGFKGAVSREVISSYVREAVKLWSDARVKTFVPLLAEKSARRRIQDGLRAAQPAT